MQPVDVYQRLTARERLIGEIIDDNGHEIEQQEVPLVCQDNLTDFFATVKC